MEKNCENCVHRDEAPGSDSCLGCYQAKCSENVTVGYHANFECVHSCKTCKYRGLLITEEPCDSCNIRLGNDKWEEDKK